MAERNLVRLPRNPDVLIVQQIASGGFATALGLWSRSPSCGASC